MLVAPSDGLQMVLALQIGRPCMLFYTVVLESRPCTHPTLPGCKGYTDKSMQGLAGTAAACADGRGLPAGPPCQEARERSARPLLTCLTSAHHVSYPRSRPNAIVRPSEDASARSVHGHASLPCSRKVGVAGFFLASCQPDRMHLPPSAHRPLLSTACRPPLRSLRASRRYACAHGSLATRAAAMAAAAGIDGGGSDGSSSRSPDPSDVPNRSGLSEVQLQSTAEQLMRLSRASIQRHDLSRNTDESMQQQKVLLLRLGFSQAAIEAAIRRNGGGPYIAEQHIGEAVAVLRRWGFSQEQLNGVLAAGTVFVFTRSAADIEAVLAWLQQEFGLRPSELARACVRSPSLLGMKQETLQANWQAFEAAYQPTEAATTALTAALRAGRAEFLRMKLHTLK